MKLKSIFIAFAFLPNFIHAQCLIEQLVQNTDSYLNAPHPIRFGNTFVAECSGEVNEISFWSGTGENFSGGNLLLTSENCGVLWTVSGIDVSSNTIYIVDLSSGSGSSRSVNSGEVYGWQLEKPAGDNYLRMHYTNTNPYPIGHSIVQSFCANLGLDLWFRISIGQPLPPLPIELSTFKVFANASQRQTMLTFSTASETNASHFVIEHGSDGKEFQEIGSLPAHGTTAEPHRYEFLHENPATSDNYYRLRMVDYDGSFEYSSIEVVHMEADDGILIFPNPVQGDIAVQFKQPVGNNLKVGLFDMTGKVYYQTVLDVETSRFTLPADGLAPGIYYLNLIDEQGSVFSRKVIKNE
ncbi:MAG: T9SS type A sorting domain-containing protein [Saprospiraceae bacterium]|nr:T9SS type A sorting domain-containing protein [Saprospiraceae bacterium]